RFVAPNIRVQPHAASVVAAARIPNLTGNPDQASVAIYDNGVQRPNVASGAYNVGSPIGFSLDGTTLYSASNGVSPSTFSRYSVSGGGLTLIDRTTNLLGSNFL